MRVKSRSIYTVLNGGCYPDQLRRKGTVAWGNADARFSSHWVGADLAVLRSDDRQSSTRAGSLGSATRSLIVKFLKPVFAGRRIATQSWAIFGIGDFRLHAPGVLKLFVDPARFLNRPMHDHGAAQRGERPLQKRRKQKRRHRQLRSDNRQRKSVAKAAFSGRIAFCASMPQTKPQRASTIGIFGGWTKVHRGLVYRAPQRPSA